MENESILQSTRAALGLPAEGTEFNFEITMHLNAALSILNMNGIGTKNISVTPETTWADFKDPEQTHGNDFFSLVPMFVFTRTKILFDPPPPSNVEFYHTYVQELLWRLRLVFEPDNPVSWAVPTISEEV